MRYNITNFNSNTFYNTAKFLFTDKKYKTLSPLAKLLYSILRDRFSLSVKNNWKNNLGDIYIIYTRQALCDLLDIKKDTASKLFRELREHQLIEEERQGINKPNLIFLTVTDAKLSNTFYKIPKFLFTEKKYKTLSPLAKLLYAILEDRHSLSVVNNWYTSKNEVFIIYTRQDLCELLNVKKGTISKLFRELREHKLITEKRQGINKPNLIFLTKKQDSANQKNKSLESQKTALNKTDIIFKKGKTSFSFSAEQKRLADILNSCTGNTQTLRLFKYIIFKNHKIFKNSQDSYIQKSVQNCIHHYEHKQLSIINPFSFILYSIKKEIYGVPPKFNRPSPSFSFFNNIDIYCD